MLVAKIDNCDAQLLYTKPSISPNFNRCTGTILKQINQSGKWWPESQDGRACNHHD